MTREAAAPLERSSKGRKRTLAAAALGLAAAAVLAMVFPALREQWYLHRLGSDSYEERKAACESLGKWGTARAVPHLFERLVREETTSPPPADLCIPDTSSSSRSATIYWSAIAKIGRPSVPHLVRQLREGSPEARPWAANLLGDVAGKEIVRELEEGEIWDLDTVEPSGFPLPAAVREALDALVAEVGAADEALSREVREALDGMGQFATSRVLAVLEKGDEAARIGAADVILGIALDSPRSEEIASAMRKASMDASPEVRRVALKARLHGLRDQTEARAPGPPEAERIEIEALFWSEFPFADVELRPILLNLLVDLRPWSETTIERVRRLLEDPDLREAALEALRESGSDPEPEPQPVELKVLPGFEDEPAEEPEDDAVESPDEDG